MSEFLQKLKSTTVQGYTMVRHPKSIALMRKGIKYEHYRDLNQGWLTRLGINTVLDVGANVGDFTKLAREVFPKAAIYSFEPLPDCFATLRSSLPGDTSFFPIETGVGSREQTLDFYRSFHSPSSSFLKMEELHKEAFPYTKDGQTAEPLKIRVSTLDSLLSDDYLKQRILAKIDVQGFEMEVIEGAEATLKMTEVVILEMSFVRLYEGQAMFHDVYEKMCSLDFTFRGSLAQMIHAESGEVVQADAIFVRK